MLLLNPPTGWNFSAGWLRRLTGLCLLALATPGWAFGAWCPESNPVIPLTIGADTLRVEVVADRASRRCGLSGRKRLAPDAGMLFVFEQDAYLTFWMQATEMPLSIAFLDRDRKILDIQQMQANDSKTRYRSPRLARYAVEAPLGWFAAHGIKPDSRCEFTLPETVTTDPPE